MVSWVRVWVVVVVVVAAKGPGEACPIPARIPLSFFWRSSELLYKEFKWDDKEAGNKTWPPYLCTVDRFVTERSDLGPP